MVDSLGHKVYYARRDYQIIEKTVDDFYKHLKKFITPQIEKENIKIDGNLLVITITEKSVTKRKLSEEALKQNMDEIGYEQMGWENTKDTYPHDEIWF